MLPGEVGPLAEQLALGQREDAGRVSDQHRVVEAAATWSRRDQVAALKAEGGRRGEERLSASPQCLMKLEETFFSLNLTHNYKGRNHQKHFLWKGFATGSIEESGNHGNAKQRL